MSSIPPSESNRLSDQNDISGMIKRAKSAAQELDWSEALNCWKAALATDPDHAPAYLGIANALRELGRFDEAEQTYRRDLTLYGSQDPEAVKIFLKDEIELIP